MNSILAMGGFAAAMSASPGPVNLITLTSGLNHGVNRTLPFVAGATIGFTLLLAAVGLGLSGLLETWPTALRLLRYAGTAFILYLALQLVRSSGRLSLETRGRPTFLEGLVLQWLNPKAWLACMAGVSAFTTAGDHGALALFCGIYFLVCFLCVGGWAVLGKAAEALVRSPRQMRTFNRCMGMLLAGVGIYLLLVDG